MRIRGEFDSYVPSNSQFSYFFLQVGGERRGGGHAGGGAGDARVGGGGFGVEPVHQTTIAAGSRCQVGRVKSSFLPKDHSKTRVKHGNMGGLGRSLMVSWKLIRPFVVSAAMSRSSGIVPQTWLNISKTFTLVKWTFHSCLVLHAQRHYLSSTTSRNHLLSRSTKTLTPSRWSSERWLCNG